ncbi:hypothetical protein [Rhodospirillaceae bacterium SYSU D60014]|uniref:hypothetical protein n=1 Tax=Virgifigura deserti TaxID=2268457 RepID=UPI000E66ED08
MSRSNPLFTLAAIERRYDGPIPLLPRDRMVEAAAQSALFDRRARNATLARARARAQSHRIPDEAADGRLARDLLLYRQAGLAWRNLSG